MEFLLLIVIIFWIICVQKSHGSCPKFVGKNGRQNPTQFNSICYYPFNAGYTYTEAKTMCESEGARLPFLDVQMNQMIIEGMMGYMVPEYWTSLEYIYGNWFWVDGSVKWLMTKPRWIGPEAANPKNAYGKSTEWVQVESGISKFVICEDVHSPPLVYGLLRFQQAGCYKVSLASSVERLVIVNSQSDIGCGVKCISTYSCEYFKQNSVSSQCELFKPGGSLNIPDCFRCT